MQVKFLLHFGAWAITTQPAGSRRVRSGFLRTIFYASFQPTTQPCRWNFYFTLVRGQSPLSLQVLVGCAVVFCAPFFMHHFNQQRSHTGEILA